MYAYRPGDRSQNKWKDEFPIRFFAIIKFDKEVDGNKEIQKKIPVEDEDIPRQKGFGKVHRSDKGDHVPESIEPSQVYHDEEDGHDDGRGGKQLPEDNDLFNGLE